jgi:hypothetical protein
MWWELIGRSTNLRHTRETQECGRCNIIIPIHFLCSKLSPSSFLFSKIAFYDINIKMTMARCTWYMAKSKVKRQSRQVETAKGETTEWPS